jgi:hypothetical protein
MGNAKFLVLAFGLASVGMAADSAPAVTIRLVNSANVPRRTLATARNQVSYILAKAGIPVRWLDCSQDVCSGTTGPAEFVVDVESRKPSGIPAESLGATLVDPAEGRCGTVASVYYSAIIGLQRSVDDIPGILAAALAHEIGHLLLGPNAHSGFGVMSPHWSREELGRASTGQLLFTSAEAERLRLATRVEWKQGFRESR